MPDLLKTLTIEADLHEVLLISLWYRKIAPQVNFNIAKKIQGVSLRCIYRGFFSVGFVHSVKALVRQLYVNIHHNQRLFKGFHTVCKHIDFDDPTYTSCTYICIMNTTKCNSTVCKVGINVDHIKHWSVRILTLCIQYIMYSCYSLFLQSNKPNNLNCIDDGDIVVVNRIYQF